ncbi:hypothetical protein BDQ17DRAFT_1350401 [Cyathus striatus]|nr:hypothetical protein BDQ17DRAFT_1378328 [Cyathus striatus]KAF9008007.1 hypothetical protein BDQ17DRAFT_1350401 [Cyathus striatus]
MALKRKFDVEVDDAPICSKQLKLIPFPNTEPDDDVAMSEAEPLYPDIHHARISSNASAMSSNASSSPTNSPAYPIFDLYPIENSVDADGQNYSSHSTQFPPSIGLLQPTSSFSHHGSGCTQIPKLRVACATGVNGQRTMWSFCEQCGAISMVQSFD